MYVPQHEAQTALPGDNAVIFYGDRSISGTVEKITRDRAGRVLRVGISPLGSGGHVAWFSPDPAYYGMWSVGGNTIAYI